MANIKVSELTETTTFDDDDYTMVVQANQSKKISKENMFKDTEDEIGTLSSLETQSTSNLVSAINSTISSQACSTTEVKTDKIWINNKPIYRKVISATSPSSTNTWATVGSISDVAILISINGTLTGMSDGRVLSVNNPEPNYEIITTFKTGNVEMKVTNQIFTSKPCYIIFEYTKTTD